MDRTNAINTPRLTLSPHGLTDFTDCAAMWADAEVTRHIGGRPFSEEETWARLLRYVGHWRALGYGFWVIREARSGRFVGEIGFADFKRDLTPSFGDAPEMGWALSPQSQGKGYAAEALAAALDWGESHFGDKRMVCMINPANAPSIRLAEGAGFRRFAEAEYKGAPTLLFER